VTEAIAPALDIAGVGLLIDGVRILEEVTFTVPRGELLAVIGPNGAGKTSLINVISGATLATSGAVHLAGRDVTRLSPHRRVRAGLGRTFQTSNLFLGLTVHENVRLAGVASRLRWSSALRPARASSALDASIAEHLSLVGLGHHSDELAGSLSHGDRRKLELAMVLIQRPDVILLDEPMAGVNIEDIDGLVELIRRVHHEEKVTVVMVEHHMDVVLDLAERIGVMHDGRLLALDTPNEITANETVQAAYVGEAL